MEPVGGPVGGDVAAVAPDGAELLAAGGAPGALAVADLPGGIERLAAFGADRLGDGRRGQVDLPPEPAQDGEREHEDGGEAKPEPARGMHLLSSFLSFP